MRWLLLLLAVVALACVGGEGTANPEPAPVVQSPPPSSGEVQPQPEPQQPPETPKAGEGVSVREVIPASVMDYNNLTFSCGTGSCTALYRSRLLGSNNNVKVEFTGKYSLVPMACSLEGSRLSGTYRNRTIIWCNTRNTKETFSSRLWWYESSFGYVSVLSEEWTQVFSDATRMKNSDFAANNTAQYVIGRFDYFASAGKPVLLKEE